MVFENRSDVIESFVLGTKSEFRSTDENNELMRLAMLGYDLENMAVDTVDKNGNVRRTVIAYLPKTEIEKMNEYFSDEDVESWERVKKE